MADVGIRAPSVQALFDAWSVEPLDRRRERRDGLDAELSSAVRLDMETMRVSARHHWIRHALAPREARIGILIFFLALALAGAIDVGTSDDSLETLLSQTFVVLAWVALWGPAYRLMTAASFRLGRRYFEELALAEITIRWD